MLQVIIETFYHMHILQNKVFSLEHEKASNAETHYLAVGPGVYTMFSIYYIPGHLRSMTDVVPFSSPGRWIKDSQLHFFNAQTEICLHILFTCCTYMRGSALEISVIV